MRIREVGHLGEHGLRERGIDILSYKSESRVARGLMPKGRRDEVAEGARRMVVVGI